MWSRRELGWLGLGGLCAWAGRPRSRRPGPPHLWLADRAFGALVRCDADGLVLDELPLAAPRALVSDGRGGVWALSAVEGVAYGPHALVHVSHDGVFVERIPCPPPRDPACRASLAVGPDGRPGLVAAGGADHALTWFGGAGARDGGLGHEPVCVAASAGVLWCVGRGGEVSAATAARRPTVARQGLPRDAEPVRIAPDLDGRAAWVLAAGAHEAWLGRWVCDAGGAPSRMWVRSFELAPAALATTPHGVAWIVDRRGTLALAVTPEARVAAWRRDLATPGVEAGVGAPDGGAWFAAGGALLRVGPRGEPRPGQGGFGHVVALSLAR